MGKRILFPPDISAIEQAQDLISRGGNLLNVKSHPGETTEFKEWRQEIRTFISELFGRESTAWGDSQRVVCFPRWFDPKVHGPFQEGEGARVTSDSQERDARRALQIYTDGITEYVAILKSLEKHVTNHGIPEKKERASMENSGNTVTIENRNEQNQEQTQTQTISLEQHLERLQQIVDTQLDEDETEQVRELLHKFKEKPGVWCNAKKLIVASAGFGRDVAVGIISAVIAAAALAAK